MKKVLSIFLAVLFCVSVFSTMTTVASAETVNNGLVIDYDFEGSSQSEILKDKAGLSAENLGAIATFDYENGIVTTNTDYNNLMQFKPNPLNATADLKDVASGDSTFLLRFKVDDSKVTADKNFYIFRIQDSDGSDPKHIGLNYRIQPNAPEQIKIGISDTSAPKNMAIYKAVNVAYTGSPWVTAAFTVKENGNSITVSVSYCYEEETTGEYSQWYTAEQTYEGKTRVDSASANNIRMFENGAPAGTSLDYIKVYNKALTLDEIKTAVALSNPAVAPTDGDAINEPALYGAQIKKEAADKYDIRFISTITSLDSYKEVGYVFNLSTWTGTAAEKENPMSKGHTTVKSNFAFLSINETVGGKQVQHDAPDGKYFVAIAITGIELTDKTDYMSGTVTPYAVDNNGNKHFGDTYTVTVVDGGIPTFEKVDK